MPVTIAELAAHVGGNVVGDSTMVIEGVAPIQSATPEAITFLERADRAVLLKRCRAGAVVVPRGFRHDGFVLVETDEPVAAFEKIVLFFSPPHPAPPRVISPDARIAASAKIGRGVRIDPFAVIGESVTIGDDCTIGSGAVVMTGSHIDDATTLFPNVILNENTVVGKRCILHAGSVIGSYGFGYSSAAAGHKLGPQYGNVVLGDDVEVGACATIDRATYGSTLIGDGTKIDNQVMIGHNCSLGRHNLICAHTGIAGSTTTGDFVVMAGRVGVKDHVHIGERAVLGAMSGILADIAPEARVVGIPATPEKEQMRIQVSLARLPEMRKEMKALQERVAQLETLKTSLQASSRD
ncbi:MAG: UDP-3-O-(3-hydroxymyristoyl)glucosamine N-acyltransferase [Thermoguttaceae bacterium]